MTFRSEKQKFPHFGPPSIGGSPIVTLSPLGHNQKKLHLKSCAASEMCRSKAPVSFYGESTFCQSQIVVGCARQSTQEPCGDSSQTMFLNSVSNSIDISSSCTRGASSWAKYWGSRALARLKMTVTKVGRPTYLSVTCSQTSRNAYSGPRTQQQISQQYQDVACAKPNAISAAMNGLAMRLLRLWPKSSAVADCEISRSFPNGNRRPF